MDEGKYAGSRKQTSSVFRQSVTVEQLQQAVEQLRRPVGKYKTRTFLSSQFLKDPPNSPPGEYSLLQYTTDFEHRNGAVETVIVAHEDGKRWLVSGYFVK